MLTHGDLLAAVPLSLDEVDIPNLGKRIRGKVRDSYIVADKRILITTDRVSAFDRILGLIPYKGQVLNQLSLWWFEQTQDIVLNHVISSPDENVTIAKDADPLPVEVVVRGYITGVTSTAMWTLYEAGDRHPYGIPLPDGLQKNDPLPHPVITPTTKAADGGHDQRLTRAELLDQGLVQPDLWTEIEQVAVALFLRGQEIAARGGLILVDTKYEFGLVDGQLTLIDEIHTPDSSRYWIKETYDEKRNPQHFDKEYLRLWFAKQGYTGEGTPPLIPPEFAAEVAGRYITAYEKLTGQEFIPGELPAKARIIKRMEHV